MAALQRLWLALCAALGASSVLATSTPLTTSLPNSDVPFTYLFADDATSNSKLGGSVDVKGTTMIVGCAKDDTHIKDGGAAAYIFQYDGSSWVQEAKLEIPTADLKQNPYAGTQVAVDGDIAVVGASHHGCCGRAFIFTRSGTTWSLDRTLDPASLKNDDSFGHTVDVSGDTVVVGAPRSGIKAAGAGAVYFFTRSGTTWREEAVVAPNVTVAHDAFGSSVAIQGDRAVVGAPYTNFGGRSTGCLYILERSGTTWTVDARLSADIAVADETLGQGVDIDGDSVIGGAPHRSEIGAAYVFSLRNGAWRQEARLTSAQATVEDLFASSVAISNNLALIGAYIGNTAGELDVTAFSFHRQGYGDWQQTAKAFQEVGNGYNGGHHDFAGKVVSVSGNTAAVSAEGFGMLSSRAGAVLVFEAALLSTYSTTAPAAAISAAATGIATAAAAVRAAASGTTSISTTSRIAMSSSDHSTDHHAHDEHLYLQDPMTTATISTVSSYARRPPSNGHQHDDHAAISTTETMAATSSSSAETTTTGTTTGTPDSARGQERLGADAARVSSRRLSPDTRVLSGATGTTTATSTTQTTQTTTPHTTTGTATSTSFIIIRALDMDELVEQIIDTQQDAITALSNAGSSRLVTDGINGEGYAFIAEVNGSDISWSVPSGNAQVTFPAQALDQFSATYVVVVQVGQTSMSFIDDLKGDVNGDFLSVAMLDNTGFPIEAVGLIDPIEIHLDTFTTKRSTCGFFVEIDQEWKDDDVVTVEADPDYLKCATYHLTSTLFGDLQVTPPAVVDTSLTWDMMLDFIWLVRPATLFFLLVLIVHAVAWRYREPNFEGHWMWIERVIQEEPAGAWTEQESKLSRLDSFTDGWEDIQIRACASQAMAVQCRVAAMDCARFLNKEDPDDGDVLQLGLASTARPPRLQDFWNARYFGRVWVLYLALQPFCKVRRVTSNTDFWACAEFLGEPLVSMVTITALVGVLLWTSSIEYNSEDALSPAVLCGCLVLGLAAWTLAAAIGRIAQTPGAQAASDGNVVRVCVVLVFVGCALLPLLLLPFMSVLVGLYWVAGAASALFCRNVFLPLATGMYLAFFAEKATNKAPGILPALHQDLYAVRGADAVNEPAISVWKDDCTITIAEPIFGDGGPMDLGTLFNAWVKFTRKSIAREEEDHTPDLHPTTVKASLAQKGSGMLPEHPHFAAPDFASVLPDANQASAHRHASQMLPNFSHDSSPPQKRPSVMSVNPTTKKASLIVPHSTVPHSTVSPNKLGSNAHEHSMGKNISLTLPANSPARSGAESEPEREPIDSQALHHHHNRDSHHGRNQSLPNRVDSKDPTNPGHHHGHHVDHGKPGQHHGHHADHGKPGHHADHGKPGHHADHGKPGHHADHGMLGHHADNGKPGHHADHGKPGHHADNGKPGHHADHGKPGHHADHGKPAHHADHGKPGGHHHGNHTDVKPGEKKSSDDQKSKRKFSGTSLDSELLADLGISDGHGNTPKAQEKPGEAELDEDDMDAAIAGLLLVSHAESHESSLFSLDDEAEKSKKTSGTAPRQPKNRKK